MLRTLPIVLYCTAQKVHLLCLMFNAQCLPKYAQLCSIFMAHLYAISFTLYG